MRLVAAAMLLAAACSAGGSHVKPADLPAAAPNDAVMAPAGFTRMVRAWARAAFTGAQPEGAIPLEVRRQDHSVLRFRQSCIDTSIRIEKHAFRHGLGTHAFSEIAVSVPAGARAFRASVGVDNNDDTGGTRGSVQFTVEIGGKVAAQTPVVRGGEEPVPLDVALLEGTREIVLKVSDGGDGVGWDQADWGDACFVMADGKKRWLDENQPDLLLRDMTPPFSFVYDGEPSTGLLPAWERTVKTIEHPGWTEYEVTWSDPKTRLAVIATVKAYKRYPAVDWVLRFENRGEADTPVIEKIQALDTVLRSGYAPTPLVLHRLAGDSCSVTSFEPMDVTVDAGKSYHMAPTGGRPASETAFPWFDPQYGDQGMITAVGWTGQWAATLDRAENGPTRLTAGMELTHLRLHPGERIRTPRIVIMPWRGDRDAAHNRWRRLVLDDYVPRHDGRPVALPIALQTADRYWQRPAWATEQGQLDYVRVAHEIGCDSVWLDAAWFPRMFPNGVGTWHADLERFPRGLKPVSDECHRLGMKFILWFEPERVAEGTEIATEHPEWIFGGAKGGLYRLDDPAARRWLTDLLARRIKEYGVDVFRNDFNIDPLGFWRANDAPDRQGITEIRYVEGLYAMWDELLARNPGLLIDNCSSGGRRIDIEMTTRSVPLWRSDTGCSPGHPEWNQMQSMAISSYVPLFTIGEWSPEPYDARSGVAAGVPCEWGYLEPGFSMPLAQATVKETDADRTFWYGDFYPLTAINTAPDQLAAWQLHRADLDAGIVLAFRRAECNTLGLIVGLHGVVPTHRYTVELLGDSRRKVECEMTGKELIDGLALRIDRQRGSLLVRYRVVKGK